MYTPTFTITNLILAYIVKYELAIEKISSLPIPQTHFETLFEKFHAEDINALGQLIGFEIGYSKALSVQRGKVLPSAKSKMKVFSNYRSVHDFITSYTSASFIRPSTELMIHINKIISKGIVDQWDQGRLRTFSEKPNEIFDTWYKNREFYPNIVFERYFEDIFKWFVEPKIKTHKLIQIAIILYELIDKAPFFTLNQISTVSTISVLLKEYGYNPNNVIPVAKSIEFINSDILSAHKMAKSKRDLTIFIEAFLYTLSLTSMDVLNEYKSMFDNKVKRYNKLNVELNPRQMKMLDYLEVEGKVSRNEYTKMMGISFMTSFRDLQDLLEKGYIVQKGIGRGTFYILSKKKEVSESRSKSPNTLEVFG